MVRVMNAAICSRGTGLLGLYVVGDVPFVSAEKYASAMAQKKMLFEGTSVKGKVMLAPAQVPVSACIRDEVMATIATTATKSMALLGVSSLVFTAFSPPGCRKNPLHAIFALTSAFFAPR
jgi:hypothetical protein